MGRIEEAIEALDTVQAMCDGQEQHAAVAARARMLRDALGAAFGSFDRWEADFRRTGMSLAGGSGWCVLVYNLHTRSLHNHWAWDHMHGAIAGVPLLALDMYEHSFHMDYGTAAAKYVDAFFRNIDWEVVDRRYAAALRGGG